jgi:FAD/FMN-containing dehydrogenase
MREVHRRNLLKGAAAVAAHSALFPTLPSWAAALCADAPKVLRRVRPGDAAWPKAESWRRLNEAVDGNLVPVQPLFAACAAGEKSPACQDVLGNIRNPFYVGDQPAGTQVSGWLDGWTPAPSVYAVRARNTADVAATVKFARAYNLRLAVKGTGHSYQGTSSAPDSLLIWTRAMNKVTLHDAFVPQGCDGQTAAQPAVTAEAGAVWIDLYHAVTGEGARYVQGGGCADTGVAGLVQSGGFGSFSKGFGLAAAGLLEAEIVTADGAVLIANACNNADLYWALKGGGGGSFGVITRVTLLTRDLPEHFGAAWGTVKAKTEDAFGTLIARFVDFYAANLFNSHWGEQIAIAPDNTLTISMVCQGFDSEQAKQAWAPFFDWVRASSREYAIADELGARATEARHWWDVAGNHSMIPDQRAGALSWHGWWKGDQDQVGAYIHGYDSVWLPAILLMPEQRSRLAAALFAASRYKKVGLHFNKGLAGAIPDVVAAARGTATNPQVCYAFALAIIADGEAPAYPGEPHASVDVATARKDARAIDRAAAELRKLAPSAGSYVSESNYFNSSWQRAFWGVNYPRLYMTKQKYDPDGLFIVHHGVGSEDWSPDGFTRLERDPNAPLNNLPLPKEAFPTRPESNSGSPACDTLFSP